MAICAITYPGGPTLSNQLTLQRTPRTPPSPRVVRRNCALPLPPCASSWTHSREGRCRTEEQRQEYLDLIATENLRLSRLTDQFLTHSRLERNLHAFHFAPTSSRAAVDAAVSALREKLEAPGCAFTLDAADHLPEILADHDGLVTILTNLLENALKYTGDAKAITLRAEVTRESLLLTVTDNGLGLTRADRKRIFKPYFQVDQKLSRAREGCGLGLSIVQQIVTAHRGRITVTSEPGESTFLGNPPAW